jgi:hypothetical protein
MDKFADEMKVRKQYAEDLRNLENQRQEKLNRARALATSPADYQTLIDAIDAGYWEARQELDALLAEALRIINA